MIHYSLPSWCSACGHLGESIQGVIAALFPEGWPNAISSDPQVHPGCSLGLVTAAPCPCPLMQGEREVCSVDWPLEGARAAEGRGKGAFLKRKTELLGGS